ncbi:hypothetical protein MTO96_019058 [Rhipicephalus appendiculatus]
MGGLKGKTWGPSSVHQRERQSPRARKNLLVDANKRWSRSAPNLPRGDDDDQASMMTPLLAGTSATNVSSSSSAPRRPPCLRRGTELLLFNAAALLAAPGAGFDVRMAPRTHPRLGTAGGAPRGRPAVPRLRRRQRAGSSQCLIAQPAQPQATAQLGCDAVPTVAFRAAEVLDGVKRQLERPGVCELGEQLGRAPVAARGRSPGGVVAATEAPPAAHAEQRITRALHHRRRDRAGYVQSRCRH